ncbi:MAG: helix-turn-helix transcriptional regulator [Actinocatenispora sp.]
MPTSPHVRALRLARELRLARQAAGFTADTVAKKIRVSRVKVTHLETAARRPDIGDVMNILEELDVTGDRFNELVRVARDAATRGWWEERQFGEMGDRQALYANLEYGAETIQEYAPALIPGLLQTGEYMRARNQTISDSDQSTWTFEGSVAGRLERQRVFDADNGPQLDVIAEEITVGRVTAQPRVMAQQLQRLADAAASHPRVRLRILPVAVDLTDSVVPHTMFQIYRYPDPGDPTVVAMEAVQKDFVWTAEPEVTPYERLWKRLDQVALPEDQSIELLAKAIKQLTKQ